MIGWNHARGTGLTQTRAGGTASHAGVPKDSAAIAKAVDREAG